MFAQLRPAGRITQSLARNEFAQKEQPFVGAGEARALIKSSIAR